MTTLERRADEAARRYVLERDRFRCVSCGEMDTQLDWAHIHGRGMPYIRWDPRNAVTLCRREHRWYTDHPYQWRRFVAELLGPDHWDMLLREEAAAERRGGSVDLVATIRELEIGPPSPDDWLAIEKAAW